MLWVQGGLSFLLWVGAAYLLVKKGKLLERVAKWSRAVRVLVGGLLLLFSTLILFAGVYAANVLFGAPHPQHGMTPGAWALITLTGVLFVLAQAVGAGTMISGSVGDVTGKPRQPSQKPEASEEKR